MKRRILLLSLALTAALAAGCGPAEPPPDITASPAPTAALPEHPAARLMAGLKKSALSSVEPEGLDPKLLTAAVRDAAQQSAEAPPETPCLWRVCLELNSGEQLELSAGLTEDLVLAALPDSPDVPVWAAKAPELYQLVRHSADVETRIDQKALEAHSVLLTRTLEDTLSWYAEDPAQYTGWSVTTLIPTAAYDPGDGSQVQFYDFRFCLLPQHPELVTLKGAAFLDGELRVHDISPTGWLAVRSRNGQPVGADFLGFSFHWDPGDPVCLDELDALLDRAERNAGLTVLADYLTAAPVQDHDYFQDEVTDYNQELIFRAVEPVTEFHFFAVEYGSQEQGYEPMEGALLYSQAELTPDRPLVINTNFPGDMPYRGFSFSLNGQRLAYTLSTSGRDGSLVVAPIP